jgi:hypothetical protein
MQLYFFFFLKLLTKKSRCVLWAGKYGNFNEGMCKGKCRDERRVNVFVFILRLLKNKSNTIFRNFEKYSPKDTTSQAGKIGPQRYNCENLKIVHYPYLINP